MQQLVTFAPDMNPLTPGILLDADGVYPTQSGGIAALPTEEAMATALAANCQGLFSFHDIDDNIRNLAGTPDALYELNITAFQDISKAGGYNSGDTDRWRFCPWGNWILATNRVDPIQVSTGAFVDFADLDASAPKAKYIIAAQNFVIAANTYDAIDGDQRNRVWWCAQGDATDWTASLSTQAGYTNLDDTPGPITGTANIGDNIVVFKERALYLGTYVGPPYVWSFQKVSTMVGVYENEAVGPSEMGLYFISEDDFYHFDGATLRRIGEGVRDWFFGRINKQYFVNVQTLFDPLRQLIFWFFPVDGSDTTKPTDALVYCYKTNRWGRVQKTIEASCLLRQANVTYDTIPSYFATYDLITPTYNDPWWRSTTFGMAIVDNDHTLQRLSGDAGSTSFTTGDIGEQAKISKWYRIWPLFNSSPTTCSITPSSKMYLGDSLVAKSASSMASGKSDILISGRFLRLAFALTGNYEINAFDLETLPISRR